MQHLAMSYHIYSHIDVNTLQPTDNLRALILSRKLKQSNKINGSVADLDGSVSFVTPWQANYIIAVLTIYHRQKKLFINTTIFKHYAYTYIYLTSIIAIKP